MKGFLFLSSLSKRNPSTSTGIREEGVGYCYRNSRVPDQYLPAAVSEENWSEIRFAPIDYNIPSAIKVDITIQ